MYSQDGAVDTMQYLYADRPPRSKLALLWAQLYEMNYKKENENGLQSRLF